MYHQVIYASATPAEYELQQSEGVLVEQIIRPTGLPDPVIEVRPAVNQVDDLLEEIDRTIKLKERVLATTLTKRMAEELSKYLAKLNIRSKYIHSDIDTIERVELLRDLRLGKFDVLVGINLLREGLDLPEVSLVAILDADKEGFLRSSRSLTQTAGRAARHLNGRVIMYADKVTDSMQQTIDETRRRREKQVAWNKEHGITPQPLVKTKEQILEQTAVAGTRMQASGNKAYVEPEQPAMAADPVVGYMNKQQLQKLVAETRRKMETAARELDFIEAARLRDEMKQLEGLVKRK